MRILGSFFGILLLSSIGVISRASAQANQQMSGSTMDAQVPAEDYGPSTGQPQTKQEEASTPTRKTPANNKDDDGDAGSDRRIHAPQIGQVESTALPGIPPGQQEVRHLAALPGIASRDSDQRGLQILVQPVGGRAACETDRQQ